MLTSFPSLFAAVLLTGAALFSTSTQAQVSSQVITPPSSVLLGSARDVVQSSWPVLSSRFPASDPACVPTHLTLSGAEQQGQRLYASASVPEFLPELRKAAKGVLKLTPLQSQELQRLLQHVQTAQQTAEPLSQATLDQFTQRTQLHFQVEYLCLQRMKAQSQPKASTLTSHDQ